MIEEPNKYFEGNPCKKSGHTLRYVRNKCCVECHKESGRKSRKNLQNSERISKGRVYLLTDFQHRVFVLGHPDSATWISISGNLPDLLEN